jgi:predicted DCC family thiol-disulfide oxidoreductase YuxK
VQSGRQSLTVYFDGACPLCQAEINHYRKQEGAGAICFLDVSRSEEMLAGDLTKQQAMKRFHVRGNDGLRGGFRCCLEHPSAVASGGAAWNSHDS